MAGDAPAALIGNNGGMAMRWGRRREGRRRMRPLGCLLWLLALVIVVIVLAELFGGFQKGSKVGGLPAPATQSFVAR